MTKHTLDETLLRTQIGLEEARRVSDTVTEMMDKNALAICATHSHISPKRGIKPKIGITPVRTKVTTVKTRLGKIMHRLYNLEPKNAPEKRVNVDLDVELYQMENW